MIRHRLDEQRPITETTKILEVGSGAHGLVFGFAASLAIGIDPLAVSYKKLFPKLQQNARVVAAIGEQLPFDDEAFDIVMSDNVIDHAEKPLVIVDELVRVLQPGGLLYFTVNIHHPIYDLASRLHGVWNAAGLKVELSAFADHTVHFTEACLREVFGRLPLRIIEQNSTVAETRAAQRSTPVRSIDSLIKKAFFKNALFEVIAIKN
jgi:ubiquinone/menaquinone biosynthesis C-methylase UbiE